MQETRTDICRLVWLFESCLQAHAGMLRVYIETATCVNVAAML